VDDVFLLDLPLSPPLASGDGTTESEKTATAQQNQSVVEGWSSPDGPPSNAGQNPGPRNSGGKLAVINLHGSFADQHPSGIETETLTIDSILQTLGANFPQIEQVRFLVDGEPRETLNGHADLMRTYPVISTASDSAQPATPEGKQ
jgi:hypothetical protein